MDLLNAVAGCTFDDFLLTPQMSIVDRRDPATIDLSARLTTSLTLKRPIVSANMDTVTRAEMAIVMAEEGGIGIIDRGFRPGDIEPQVREVMKVKRTQHGVIPDPLTIAPEATLADARAVMARARVGTLVVIAGDWHLEGLLTERDLQFVDDLSATVASRMTPRNRLVTFTGRATEAEAAAAMAAHRVKKLPLVDQSGRLIGLVTARDLVRQRELPFATRDDQGRLRVGAAIGARGDYLERAAELIRAGVDVLVIDIAHGHSLVMERALTEVRKRFPVVDVIAGNVATADGARFLADRGASAVKVGIGPGGGCTTRLTTSFGVPQLQAIVECRRALGDGVPLIADGGIKRHGAIALALMCGGDTVMLGSAFAGTTEAPGDIVHKSVLLPESQKPVKVPFKVLRGMASIEAIKDRLDVEDASAVDLQAIGAEGMEVSVPLRGSARPGAAGDDEAPVLVDQLRRRGEPPGPVAAPSGRPGAISGEAERVVATGVLRSMIRTLATALRLGLATLRLNPLRTSLSTLGIIMGAASLAAVLALGDGAEVFARQRIEREGLQAIRLASRMHDEVDGQRVPRTSWVTFVAADGAGLAETIGASGDVRLSDVGSRDDCDRRPCASARGLHHRAPRVARWRTRPGAGAGPCVYRARDAGWRAGPHRLGQARARAGRPEAAGQPARGSCAAARRRS